MNSSIKHHPKDDDSMSDYSDAESVRSDDEEDLEDYKKGGYHPVSIGDRFSDGRYIAVRKLGWGHFSTVWLAYDTIAARHVALKIVKSADHFTESALEEVKLLEAVKKSDPQAGGWKYVAQMLDSFYHTGPNGKHVCMTFEVLGESLLSLIKRYRYRGIPTPIVKRITKQILLGLDYLHRECGIIHTDIKPENVLVWIPNVEEYLKKETADTLAQFTSNGHTSYLKDIDTTGMSKARKKRLKRRIKQKEAKAAAKAREENHIHSSQDGNTEMRGKEKMSGLAVNDTPIIRSSVLDFTTIIPASDSPSKPFENIVVKIADLGNACWLLTGEFLFDPRAGSKYDKDDDHLAQIIELTLRAPRSLIMDGELSRDFFNRKGELRRIKKLRYRRLRDVLHDQFQMPPKESDSLNEFLSPMLEVDATKRASAHDMLRAKWLQDTQEN
ncbi:kinase-like domain-containing protein [Dichotomocladium elegans]|nr:kinase-like domain-containing protein [Dichotomocladium elegans]